MRHRRVSIISRIKLSILNHPEQRRLGKAPVGRGNTHFGLAWTRRSFFRRLGRGKPGENFFTLAVSRLANSFRLVILVIMGMEDAESRSNGVSYRMARTVVIVIVLASTIGCDRISKNMVREKVGYNQQISLIKGFLILTNIENSGAFLSLGHRLPQPVKTALLTILPMAVLCVTLFFLVTKNSLPHRTTLGICLIAGGGIGNIYDRLVYGSVTDFLHLDLGIFQTGIFNMADVSIMTGMVIVLMEAYVNRADYSFRAVDEHER